MDALNKNSTISVPVIEVNAVHKSFKAVHAVRGVNLRISRGQYVALLGPNGAGKTTLVEMIEGIQKPDSGEIFIMGKNWTDHSDELHRIIGLSLQETRFIDKLTVFETLNLFASFYQLKRQRVHKIIETVGLSEKKKAYVVNLSGGQRQRLALGIALLNKPQVLLLDEPTTGLDPNARRELWSILLDLKQQKNTSLILTTHYMEEAEQLCDYIIIIDQGQILTEGTRKHLLEDDFGEQILEFSLEQNHVLEQDLVSTDSFNIQWDTVHQEGTVLLDNMENELPKFLEFLKRNNLRLKNLDCRRKTLDDLFISLTGRHLNE
jgi:ABC-2 type transport system ATP-binding protein